LLKKESIILIYDSEVRTHVYGTYEVIISC
jgi:hypothetical protein